MESSVARPALHTAHWHAGVKTLPYFMANTAINLIDVALQPLVFCAVYYSLTQPYFSFYQVCPVPLLRASTAWQPAAEAFTPCPLKRPLPAPLL